MGLPVQVTARVSFHSDWKLRVAKDLGADGGKERYLYNKRGQLLTASAEDTILAMEITSHDDFPLAITWMVYCHEKLRRKRQPSGRENQAE